MKSTLRKIVISSCSALLVVAPLFASAKNKAIALGSVTTNTFGVEGVAFVRSNPLFSLVRVVDDMKGSFATDKLASRTEMLNQYAARLLKTYEVSPKNEKWTLGALRDYQNAIYQYAIVLSHLDSKVDEAAIDTVVSTLVRHLRLIDEATAWPGIGNAHYALLSDIRDRMSSVAVSEIEDVIGAENFVAIATDGLADRAVVEQLRTAEVFDIIARAAAHKGVSNLATTLLQSRSMILTSLAASGSDLVASVGSVACSPSERLQTVLFLLNTPELRNDQQLIDLRNLLLIRVF